jgi:phosphoribosyl 1,2-cyclic phosphodiesterase
MRFTFCPLFSGSSGNAIFVGAGDTRILIDAGMPGRSIENALREIDILPETLSGIVVTHEHSDHVKGVGILSRKYFSFCQHVTRNKTKKAIAKASIRKP